MATVDVDSLPDLITLDFKELISEGFEGLWISNHEVNGDCFRTTIHRH